MQKYIIEHLSSVTTVYDSQISQKLEVEYEARPEKSKRKAMNRNWSNQKANPALNTKAGNK